MTDKELINNMQEALDDLDNQIANLPACSIRNMMVAQREHYSEFIQLLKTDGVVRASYKTFIEECDRYEEAGFDEATQARFAWEAVVDLGTMDYVANKMVGGDDDEHLS